MMDKVTQDRIKEICHKGAVVRIKYQPCLCMWDCKIVKAIRHDIDFDETNEVLEQEIGKDLEDVVQSVLNRYEKKYSL